MNYCFHCGKEIPEGGGFCPYCGQSLQQEQPVYAAEPAKPINDGGVKGKSIAGLILGAEGTVMGLLACLYCLIEGFIYLLIRLVEDAAEMAPFSLIFYLYVFIFAVISLGSCIAARILSMKALEKNPEFKVAKAGKILGLAGIIVAAVALVCGLLPLLTLL